MKQSMKGCRREKDMLLQIAIKVLRFVNNIFTKIIDQPAGWFIDFITNITRNIWLLRTVTDIFKASLIVFLIGVFFPFFVTSVIFALYDSNIEKINEEIQKHRTAVYVELTYLKDIFPNEFLIQHNWRTDGF